MKQFSEQGISLIAFQTVFLVFLVLGCGTSTKMEMPLPWASQVADIPKMVVGDSWVYDRTGSMYVQSGVLNSTVIHVDGDGSYVVQTISSKGEHWIDYYNNKTHLIRTEYRNPSKPAEYFNPPTGLRFPLFVGKKWEDQVWGTSVSGYKFNYRNVFDVTAMEIVETKAGSFPAYRIRQVQYVGFQGGVNTRTFWYAPSAKVVIKRKPDLSASDLGELELVSYKLAGEEKKEPRLTPSPRDATPLR